MSDAPADQQSLQRVILSPLLPALGVGAATAQLDRHYDGFRVIGLVAGRLGGIIVSEVPNFFAATAGLQCLGLGSIYWYVRNVDTRGSNRDVSSRESILRSSIAGSVSGAVNGAFRSRSNIIPGALMFGMLGLVGQGAYNNFRPGAAMAEVKTPLVQRILESRWMPVKPISDQDYVAMLQERALRIDAEIAIIDDKISTLQNSKENET